LIGISDATGVLVEAVWAMFAAALATMTSFEVIMFREDDESFRAVVKVLWLQVFRHGCKDRLLSCSWLRFACS
jgi:hypothetical protein